MTPNVRPVPEGYHTVTPYLCLAGADRAIAFYKAAFGAIELSRMAQPDGRIGHAEIQIGSSRIMLADEFPEVGFKSPGSLGGSPVMLHLYVEDSDAMIDRAVAAGATVLRPVKDEFYGDRGGQLQDPFGHVWYISTHVEDVSADELQARMAKAR